ncbi:MAG: KH domain-containing protein [Bellilinea sp.]|nr:RNA-binding protein [Anaerolinea sp.]OGN76983.1 MAG: RNA-binding protein [Chloroflexi bacterium GWB2_54_36]HAL15268.1 RNA-binding protein [Anaerolineaceae bacterium]HBA91185.1 RNA-binding protein [Anaerolineaceae bacterium]
MKELIEYIARSLVEDPTQVVVEQERLGGKVRLELSVAKEDMGRVIGKSGRVANAMRILLRVAAAREGKQANLDVLEPR